MPPPRQSRHRPRHGKSFFLGLALITLADEGIAQEENSTHEVQLLLAADKTYSEPARATLSGVVAWRSTPLLIRELTDIGGSGWYRRTLHVYDLETGKDIGEDFAMVEPEGMRTLLTCVGTPRFLSPYPERTSNSYGTGVPEYARFMPVDALAWADYLLQYLAGMEAQHGVVPDGIELWNELDRVEWANCTVNEYLEFYRIVASRLRAARPTMQIGGPGIAGYRSNMDGAEPMLFAMLRYVALTGAPFDFVSWHHYAPGTELRFSQNVALLRALGAGLGLTHFETAITEWNIAPSAQGTMGPEFDGPHAAANLVAFYATGAAHGLDRNYLFLDRDEENDRGITDLEGVSMGALTKHGIRKPVARSMELMLDPAFTEAVPVEPPTDEYNVACYASRSGNLIRLAIANDVVTPTWMFANSARQFGMESSWLYPLWLAAGGPRATLATLMAQGLTLSQAQATVAFMPMVLLSDLYDTQPRPIRVVVLGTRPFTIQRVIRFTETVNAPAQHRNALLPLLTTIFDNATLLGCDACAQHLTAGGFLTTGVEVFLQLNNYYSWAASRGIPYALAESGWKQFLDTRRDMQLKDADLLNDLPETRVVSESAAAAGITVVGRELTFQLDPNTVVFIEISG